MTAKERAVLQHLAKEYAAAYRVAWQVSDRAAFNAHAAEPGSDAQVSQTRIALAHEHYAFAYRRAHDMLYAHFPKMLGQAPLLVPPEHDAHEGPVR